MSALVREDALGHNLVGRVRSILRKGPRAVFQFLNIRPMAISFAIGGALLASWAFDGAWALLGGLVLGLFVGGILDQTRLSHEKRE